MKIKKLYQIIMRTIFSVDFGLNEIEDILDIHKYLMRKQYRKIVRFNKSLLITLISLEDIWIHKM